MALFSQSLLSLGAPDCPVVHRTVSGAPGWHEVNWPLSGIHRRRTAIIHRTVRCAPDCPVSQRSVGPTVGRGIHARHVADPTARRGHRTCPVCTGHVRCAPDCPVCTGHVRCANGSLATNGRLRRKRKEIGHRTLSGVHRTVRCARRQKARMAFQICSQRLLAALGL
jgi:hypothetical protein